MLMRTQRRQRARFVAGLVSGFSTLALVLAGVGIFGVTAYAVSQRRREFGIRLALGAQRSGIGGLVLRRVALLVGLGVAAGIGLALALGSTIGSLLFGVQPDDPGTFAIAAGALLGITVVPVLMVYLIRGAIPSEERNPINRVSMAIYDVAFRVVMRHPVVTLLIAVRLIPIVPFSLVCYAAGAARVPLWRFVWTTVVGYLPITALSVYFGTRLEGLEPTDPLVFGSAAALLALLLCGHWFVRRQAPGSAS